MTITKLSVHCPVTFQFHSQDGTILYSEMVRRVPSFCDCSQFEIASCPAINDYNQWATENCGGLSLRQKYPIRFAGTPSPISERKPLPKTFELLRDEFIYDKGYEGGDIQYFPHERLAAMLAVVTKDTQLPFEKEDALRRNDTDVAAAKKLKKELVVSRVYLYSLVLCIIIPCLVWAGFY